MNDIPFDIDAFQKSLQFLRPKERLDAFLDHPNPMMVVRQLPAQDLFITLKEVGLVDCPEILELVSSSQFQNFLDLDGWHHDKIDTVAIGSWLESIATANPKRAVQFFRELDVELISLLFKMYAQVYDLTLEEEPDDMGLAHSTTPDGRYLIVFHAEKTEQNLIYFLREALQQLYQRDLQFTIRLIENVRWETISSLEEESLKWRDGRMQDMGFAPLSETKDILAYIDPTTKPKTTLVTSPTATMSAASLLLYGIKSDRFFYQAVDKASEEVRRRVLHELVTTANRVHVALGIDLGDTQSLLDTVHHTLNTIEIALTYLSNGDQAQTQSILKQNTVMRLFQIGHSLALQLGRHFRKVITDPNSGLSGNGILCLDSPLAEVAAGILLPEPMYYAGLSDPRKINYRRFETLNDIATTAAAISESIFRAYLLGPKGVGVTQEKLQQLKLGDKAKLPTHSILLATWLCHHILKQTQSLTPFEQDEVDQLWDRLHLVKERHSFPQNDIQACQDLIQKIAFKLVPCPSLKTKEEAKERVSQYVRSALGTVEAEFGTIQNKPVNTRLIKSILAKIYGELEPLSSL